MSHLSSFEIENFKSFGSPFKFEFAPITILTGTNSSGKSNLIKALSLLKNSGKENFFFQMLDFYKDKRLGSFNNSLNNQSGENSINFKFPLNFTQLSGDYYIELRYSEEHNEFRNNGILSSIAIYNEKDYINETLFIFKRNDIKHISDSGFINKDPISGKETIYPEVDYERQFTYKLNLDLIASCLKNIPVKQFEDDHLVELRKEILTSHQNLHTKLNFLQIQKNDKAFDGFYQNSLTKNLKLAITDLTTFDYKNPGKLIFKYKGKDGIEIQENNEVYKSLVDFEKRIIQKLSTKEFTIDAEEIIHDFFETPGAFQKFIQDTIFDFIEDEFKLNEDIRISHTLSKYGNDLINTFFIGHIEKAFETIRSNFEMEFLPSVRGTQSHIITAYENVQGTIFSISDEFLRTSKPYLNIPKQFIDYWLKAFHIGDFMTYEGTKSGIARALTIDNRNIADLGFGFTQLILIILQIGVNANKNFNLQTLSYFPSTICIEEPESNLHPSLQSQLADLFIDAADKFNIMFIIETHSEYLIRKLQYWITKRIIKHDAVNIYYFNVPKNAQPDDNQIKKIQIDEEGILSDDFGTGFFDEADKIAISIWNLTKSSKN